MKNLLGEANKLTELRKSIQANDSSIEDENSSIIDTKREIYLRCLIMVISQFVYTNAINVYNYHTVLVCVIYF